jgi:hypothetical protein
MSWQRPGARRGAATSTRLQAILPIDTPIPQTMPKPMPTGYAARGARARSVQKRRVHVRSCHWAARSNSGRTSRPRIESARHTDGRATTRSVPDWSIHPVTLPARRLWQPMRPSFRFAADDAGGLRVMRSSRSSSRHLHPPRRVLKRAQQMSSNDRDRPPSPTKTTDPRPPWMRDPALLPRNPPRLPSAPDRRRRDDPGA